MESEHLLNSSVQNALDSISENLINLKNFPGRACAPNSVEKCAVRSPDGRYIAPILLLYTISLGPLYHNILRPPLLPRRNLLLITLRASWVKHIVI